MHDMATFTSARNDFGFRLLGELLGATSGPNLIISPLSVSLGLSMANEGARGATRAAIEQTLMAASQASGLVDPLLASLVDVEGIEVDVANSVWSRADIALRSEYVDTLYKAYRAQAVTLDFSSPLAPG